MRIQPTNLYSFNNNKVNNKNNISYKGNYGTVYSELGNMKYRVNTWFFREDFDWNSFPKFIDKIFKNADKVNIYNYGCSSGEETYSLIMKLINTLGKCAKKFFPIIAKDIDEANIEKAKKGVLYVTSGEKGIIEIFTKNGKVKNHRFTESVEKEYYDRDKQQYTKIKGFNVVLNNYIKNNIKFSKADILKDIDNIEGENIVLMCRNMWAYLKEEDRELLMEKIDKKFINKNSLLVIGDFDIDYPFHEFNQQSVLSLLDKHNFRKTEMKNVYQKIR